MSEAASSRGNTESHIPQLSEDRLDYGYISEIQQRQRSKLYNPLEDSTAVARLQDRRQQWADDGVVTVFTSGVFDLLHLDHSGYLLHTKATGAAELYRREGLRTGWDDLNSRDREAFTNECLSNRQLRLIVSVDGDKSVATRKGYKSEKGSGPRPIYSWETRALTVASQAFVDPEGSDVLLPTADAVTIHGPHDFDPPHPHATHFSVVEHLQPDVWAVFGESKDVLEGAPLNKALGAVALHLIKDGEGTHYYKDRFMGKISTTKIINRALGNQE